ncbi:hypothetical protein V8E36_008311 [Tilletia maclaganii]
MRKNFPGVGFYGLAGVDFALPLRPLLVPSLSLVSFMAANLVASGAITSWTNPSLMAFVFAKTALR